MSALLQFHSMDVHCCGCFGICKRMKKERSAWVGFNSRAATISQIIAKIKHSLKIFLSLVCYYEHLCVSEN